MAIAVFLLRELLEARRRKVSRERKLAAIKTILARACELNHWTVKTLRRVLEELQQAFADPPAPDYEVEFRRNGDVVITEVVDGARWSSGPLPVTHSQELETQLLDVAELDAALQALLDAALTGLAEVRHVRDSLISHVLSEEEYFEQHDGLFESFLEYGLEEISDAFTSLETLYFACTGKQLTEHRLR